MALLNIFWISSIIFVTTQVVGATNNAGVVERNLANSEDDAAFENFMWVVMRNYSNWLSLNDPLPPIADEIQLQSDKRADEGVEATLNITNQYMRGHSHTLHRIFTAVADLNRNTFSVTWAAGHDQLVEFGGDYATNGKVEFNNQVACFRGNGTWNLKLNDSFEFAQFVNFEVNGEGYIDLRRSIEGDHTYLYNVDWTYINFEGLELVDCWQNKNEDGSNNVIAVASGIQDIDLTRVLAQVYMRFLNSFANEYSFEVIPPKRLLFDYITNVLSETKLSDILSDWATPTSTPPTDDSEKNAAFENFLWFTMRNYSNWLSLNDPLPPIVDEIQLKSDKRIDEGVDASLNIFNQSMTDHSNAKQTTITPFAELKSKIFSVSRAALYDQLAQFGGDYTANGTAQLDNQNVCFQGNGKWHLKFNDSFEYAQFLNFEVNDEGYIDLSRTSEIHNYLYSVDWAEINFEGLEIIDCEQNRKERGKNVQDVNVINRVLAQVYRRFLNSFSLDFPYAVIPTKRLLFPYLTTVLSKTKLSDIISDWAPPTSTTTDDDSGTGNAAFGNFQPNNKMCFTFVIFLTMATVM